MITDGLSKARHHSLHTMLYVGSASVGVTKQQLNQKAVYRCLQSSEFFAAEPALRYRASHGNLLSLQSYHCSNARDTVQHGHWSMKSKPLGKPSSIIRGPRPGHCSMYAKQHWDTTCQRREGSLALLLLVFVLGVNSKSWCSRTRAVFP